jgi:hypothetical protein
VPKYLLRIGDDEAGAFDSFEAAIQAAKAKIVPDKRATIERGPYANDPNSGATFYFAQDIKQWVLSS